jgi:hypothetical protein
MRPIANNVHRMTRYYLVIKQLSLHHRLSLEIQSRIRNPHHFIYATVMHEQSLSMKSSCGIFNRFRYRCYLETI